MTINISLSNLANLQNETTAISTINANSATIQGGFTTALNTTGDQMQGTLDMNSNQIINLPTPGTANSPLRLSDLVYLQGGGTVIFPTISGGTNISVPASTTGTYTVSTITGPVFTTVSTTTLTVHNAITASTITATTINGSTGKFSTITISNNQPISFSNSAGAADAQLLEVPSGGVFFLMGTAANFYVTDRSQNPLLQVVGVGNAGPYLQVNGATTAALSQVNVLASLSSSSISTGALTVAGGLGVAQSIYASTINATTANITTLTISSFTGPVTTASLNSGSNAQVGTFWQGNGTWVAPPSSAVVSITTLTAATTNTLGASSIFTSAYDSYEIALDNITPSAASSQIYLQLYSGTGYSATTYLQVYEYYNSGGGPTLGSAPTTALNISGGSFLGTTSPGLSGTIKICNPSQTSNFCVVQGDLIITQNGAPQAINLDGWWGTTTAVTGVQIFVSTSSATINSGKMKIYGIV